MRMNLIDYEEAVRLIYSSLPQNIGVQRVWLYDALNHILAEDIFAPFNMPECRRLAMDGYIFSFSQIQEILSHSQDEVFCFKVHATLAAQSDWEEFQEPVVLKAFTGARLPIWGDCLVLIEEIIRTQDEQIWISRKILENLKPLKHIREKGENFSVGEILLQKGTHVQAAEIGLLASLNQLFVQVYQQPKIAILCGGNELVDIGESPSQSHFVRSINNHLLYSLVLQEGAIPLTYPLFKDDKKEALELLQQALQQADLILFSGGMSYGDFDLIPYLLESQAQKVYFYGVNMKPGKPTAYATINDKPLLGLAGFPNATYMGFYLFARPIINALKGSTSQNTTFYATLLQDFFKDDPRVEFRPAFIQLKDGQFYASLENKKHIHSAAINNLCGENSGFVIAKKNHYKKGEQIEIIPNRQL
ncbi:hypothetical protein CCZ01_02900 [Helicobacter monodelphidis]|uniref:molybdopterin molybdotransferase MoeA n=1 Tax=Helicobacter sp. 15-1451 TaxID=2004995 RepID=UPI000DCE73EB|nr:molybdopterin molybdotransferase MoeA [Helicobacter sp. 15-1451]RAX58380.1 hypothetical protein CCZ01_02900 [Helicobacter sp. 15-1451]